MDSREASIWDMSAVIKSTHSSRSLTGSDSAFIAAWSSGSVTTTSKAARKCLAIFLHLDFEKPENLLASFWKMSMRAEAES